MVRLLGLEGAAPHRRPLLTGAVIVAMVVVYVPTWHTQRSQVERADDMVDQIVLHWNANPHLSPPESFVARYGTDALRGHIATKRRDVAPPAPEVHQEARRHLALLLDDLRAVNASLSVERWGLVPTRGLWQPGWFTYWWLHGGLQHLLLNLLLLAAVAPLLEDAWRRGWLAGFFLGGAIAAAGCHVAFAPASSTPLIGASGLASACFGAFTTRFANRRVFFALGQRRVGLPCLVWGALFFASQAWAVGHADPTTEISFVAHLGGFGFGAVVVGAAYVARVEGRLDRRIAVPDDDSAPGDAEAPET